MNIKYDIITKKDMEEKRKIRAYCILAKGDTPKMVDNETYIVPSQSNPELKYKITHYQSWECSCPDYKKRHLRCKHIQAVEMWMNLRAKLVMDEMGFDNDILEIQDEIIERELICSYCKSINVVKDGYRDTKIGRRQRYLCNACKRKFVIDPIKGRKATAKIITLCMDLYYTGLSYRKIADTIYQFYDIDLHHETIRRWINKFMKRMNEYTKQFKPELGKKWQVDEQKVKSDGNWVWSWNAIDEKTRFLIANSVTIHRSDRSAQKVFKKIKEVTDEKPSSISTDGLTSYPNAIKKIMGTDVKHIKNVGIADKINNNKVERFHGSWRERDKVMRGLGNSENVKEMLENYRTYYNFLRKHQGLDGKTPSEMAGITIEGDNKWLTLMKKSIQYQKAQKSN